MSSGLQSCPFPSQRPDDVVLSPGTLVDQAGRTVGAVTYKWYQWSATCNLNGTSGAPVTNSFDAQVWWLPSAGIAFVDVVGHPQVTGILGSVRAGAPVSPTTTTPPGNVEFHSPTGNIHCGITYSPNGTNNTAHCFTDAPAQSATLAQNGVFSTCAGPTCLGTPGPGETELPYGQNVSNGPFNCASAITGVTCMVNGQGFQISRSGIFPTG